MGVDYLYCGSCGRCHHYDDFDFCAVCEDKFEAKCCGYICKECDSSDYMHDVMLEGKEYTILVHEDCIKTYNSNTLEKQKEVVARNREFNESSESESSESESLESKLSENESSENESSESESLESKSSENEYTDSDYCKYCKEADNKCKDCDECKCNSDCACYGRNDNESDDLSVSDDIKELALGLGLVYVKKGEKIPLVKDFQRIHDFLEKEGLLEEMRKKIELEKKRKYYEDNVELDKNGKCHICGDPEIGCWCIQMGYKLPKKK